jgi:hypothetical protein
MQILSPRIRGPPKACAALSPTPLISMTQYTSHKGDLCLCQSKMLTC